MTNKGSRRRGEKDKITDCRRKPVRGRSCLRNTTDVHAHKPARDIQQATRACQPVFRNATRGWRESRFGFLPEFAERQQCASCTDWEGCTAPVTNLNIWVENSDPISVIGSDRTRRSPHDGTVCMPPVL